MRSKFEGISKLLDELIKVDKEILANIKRGKP